MDIIPFRNMRNDEACDEENDILKLDNTSNDLNDLDGDFINANLCDKEKEKKKKTYQPSFLKNEITGLKLYRKNRVGKRILLGNNNEKPKLPHNNLANEFKKKKTDGAYKLMKVITTPSNRSEGSEYIREQDYRVVPVIPANNGTTLLNNRNIIIPYQKLQEFCSIVENKKNQKCKNFLIYSPDIIQKWIRVIFNVVITSLIITLIYFVFVSVREDINKKIAIQKQNIKEDSLSCKKQYEAHKCGTVNLPLLSEKCDEWLKCMKADSNLYQDISFLSAQMLGQIINAFIVQFEWKSICVIAFIFLLIFIGSNYALSIGGSNRYSGDVHYSPPAPLPAYPFYQNYPIIPNMYSPLGAANPMAYNMRYANITTHSDPFINSSEFASTAATNNNTYQPYYDDHFYEETNPNMNNSNRVVNRKGLQEFSQPNHISGMKENNINNGDSSFTQKIFNLWGGSNKRAKGGGTVRK